MTKDDDFGDFDTFGAACAKADDATDRSPEFTDEALAQDFAHRHGGDLRYVAAWSRWFRWNGQKWGPDHTLLAFDEARKICRQAARDCHNKKTARILASGKTVAAVERLARSDRRLAATIGQWDADPWILNTPDGIVDLQTGKLHRHRATDYLTRITAVAPGGECRRWLKFLRRVTNGDADLQGFLQRMCGYALTGITRDHALFFGYGTGANGKTVFTATASGILGDYHCAAPIETFTATTTDRHPTELADLRGARLVTAVETEEGRRWAESRIKMLTGGERVKARFMRQDLFEFVPQLKLFIVGNHKPGLRSVDEAMRRRFHLIPFAVTIPPKGRDADLVAKLEDEWPGILAWMVKGCLEWQRLGLQPPVIVREATDSYLEAEDAIAAWIDEAITRNPNGWERTSELFASWTAWSTKSGEFTGNIRRFVQSLETHGFMPERRMTARGFRGLTLSPDLRSRYGAP